MYSINFEMHEEIAGVGVAHGHVALTKDRKLQDELCFEKCQTCIITEKNIDEIKDCICRMRDKLEQVKLVCCDIFGFEIYQGGE